MYNVDKIKTIVVDRRKFKKLSRKKIIVKSTAKIYSTYEDIFYCPKYYDTVYFIKNDFIKNNRYNMTFKRQDIYKFSIIPIIVEHDPSIMSIYDFPIYILFSSTSEIMKWKLKHG